MRTKKTLSSGNYVSYHILDGTYVGDTRVINNVTYRTLYLFDDAGAVIGLQSNGTKYWFAKNLQGDVVGILSNSGTLLARYTYDPWGKLTSVKNASGVTITDASNIALRNPFRYRSYMYDDETGFYYLRARYYDPLTKRFLNADEAETINATPSDVTDNNLFAYCDNNPVTRKDDGGEFWHIVIGAAIGAVVGAVSSVVSQVASGQGVNLAKVGISAATGAASGALAATGVGLVGSIAGNAAISMAGNVANQVIANKGFKDFDVGDMLIDGAIGAVAGAVGGRGASYGNSKTAITLGKQLTRRVVKNGEVKKAFAYYTKNMMTTGSKRIYHELNKSILKGGAATTIGTIAYDLFN